MEKVTGLPVPTEEAPRRAGDPPSLYADNTKARTVLDFTPELRAAAKNFARVLVVCDPADYERVLTALREDTTGTPLRRQLATKAFAHTRDYDTAITAYLEAINKR